MAFLLLHNTRGSYKIGNGKKIPTLFQSTVVRPQNMKIYIRVAQVCCSFVPAAVSFSILPTHVYEYIVHVFGVQARTTVQ